MSGNFEAKITKKINKNLRKFGWKNSSKILRKIPNIFPSVILKFQRKIPSDLFRINSNFLRTFSGIAGRVHHPKKKKKKLKKF
jgi:hypothetical protein